MSGQQQREDFAEVAEACYEKIYRGALSVTRDRHLAEEIVQETFNTAFMKFDSFSGKSSVLTWLYRIMLNNYCNYCRRRKMLRKLGIVRGDGDLSQSERVMTTARSPSAELASSEERELLLNAVDGLPTKLRVVVAMHYFDDLPVGEIATILKCSMGTVKSRLFNARRRLCEILQRKLRNEQESGMPRS